MSGKIGSSTLVAVWLACAGQFHVLDAGAQEMMTAETSPQLVTNGAAVVKQAPVSLAITNSDTLEVMSPVGSWLINALSYVISAVIRRSYYTATSRLTYYVCFMCECVRAHPSVIAASRSCQVRSFIAEQGIVNTHIHMPIPKPKSSAAFRMPY